MGYCTAQNLDSDLSISQRGFIIVTLLREWQCFRLHWCFSLTEQYLSFSSDSNTEQFHRAFSFLLVSKGFPQSPFVLNLRWLIVFNILVREYMNGNLQDSPPKKTSIAISGYSEPPSISDCWTFPLIYLLIQFMYITAILFFPPFCKLVPKEKNNHSPEHLNTSIK